MRELWEQALLSYNLPLTVAMGLVALYWFLSVLGAVDVDTLDVNFDVDTEADIDGIGEGEGGSFLGGVMKFVNAQDVPLMIIVSLLTLFMWLISMTANYYLNSGQSDWIALALLAINFVVSVCLVKAVTQPLRPFLRALKHDQEHQEPLIGLVGTVKSRVIDAKYGQVEVPRIKGAPALLNARVGTDQEPLVRGDEVLVIAHDQEESLFIVKSTKLLAVKEEEGGRDNLETTTEVESNTTEE